MTMEVWLLPILAAMYLTLFPSRWRSSRNLSALCVHFLPEFQDRFAILSTLEILRNKIDMQKCYRLPYVFLMGIFEASRPMESSPSYSDFLDEAIWPQVDDDLTIENVLDRVLDSVSAVVFDNQDNDPFVRSILDKARALGKRMIDINSANS